MRRFQTLLCLTPLLVATTASAELGMVGVVTVPGEAQVYINGEHKGDTLTTATENFAIQLEEGEYRIGAKKPGYGLTEQAVKIGPGSIQIIQLTLAPEIAMVPIKGGCFMMGTPETELDRDDDEGPQHEVCVSDFEMGKHEVTFDDWQACVDADDCFHEPDDRGWGEGKRPLINISWDDAQDYIRWLNRATGEQYRLPTEAEWEYAGRAGTTTAFYTGDCLHTDDANYDGTCEFADCGSRTQTNINLGKTVPVGSYEPNAFGLYDMHGNVSEWVQDCWNESFEGAPADGSAWEEGNCRRRVLRGGSWFGYAGYSRSGYRCRAGTSFQYKAVGFRLARTPKPAS